MQNKYENSHKRFLPQRPLLNTSATLDHPRKPDPFIPKKHDRKTDDHISVGRISDKKANAPPQVANASTTLFTAEKLMSF